MKASPQKVALGSFIGTTIEWYDFFLYGTASALIFSKLFFPDHDPLMATLLSFATFGVAFVARPAGGIIFGHFGDRIGRKPVLVITLIIMGVSTGLVGLLPTYESIGVAAPLLLVLLRIIQGLSLGGEYGGAVLMAFEHVGRKRKAFYGSWVQAGSPAGLVLANLAFLGVSQLPDEQLFSWGWRIPFLVSFVLVIVGLIIRASLEESPDFTQVQKQEKVDSAPLSTILKHHWKPVLSTAGAYISAGVTVYVGAVYILNYATEELVFTRTESLMLVVLGQVFAFFLMPVFGLLADRIGYKRTFIGGISGMGLLAFPWLALLHTEQFVPALLGFFLLLIPYSACYASMGVFFAQVYETRLRYSGLSLGYQLGTIAGSAFAPIIATQLLASTGTVVSLGFYMVIAAVVSIICAILLARNSSGGTQDQLSGTQKNASASAAEMAR